MSWTDDNCGYELEQQAAFFDRAQDKLIQEIEQLKNKIRDLEAYASELEARLNAMDWS